MKYNVFSIDVWAGEIDETWQENNYFLTGEVELERPDDDEGIIASLIAEGYLKSGSEDQVTIADYSDGYWIYVRQKDNGYPLYNLHRQAEYNFA